MSDTAITVHDVGKMYRIGETIRHDTLRDAISHYFSKAINRKRRERKAGHDIIWALRDVSFEVRRGEVVGVIGKNGAGKSTLLKILSRITEPTRGRAVIRGRVGSLLEVGTGFHGELTGRENIFLNGAILGMSRREIRKKFDEIVDFSEVEKFIDTPVKRYSSGMYVRLAFAVAAHLEPEILLVDEVLAVGDVAFQKKCLGKMDDVSKEGRTILFVSHNLTAIRNLCRRSILFRDGALALDGSTERVIGAYLDQNLIEGAVVAGDEIEKRMEGYINKGDPKIRIREVALLDKEGLPRKTFYSDESIMVRMGYECMTAVNDLVAVVQIVDDENRPLLTTQNCDDPGYPNCHRHERGRYTATCTIPPHMFGEKRFYISVQLFYPKIEHIALNKILGFDITFQAYNNAQYNSIKDSFFRPRFSWTVEPVPCAVAKE